MTHEEFADFIDKVETFDCVVFNQTNRHLDAGEDKAAGALLILKARLTIAMKHYRDLFVVPVAPAAPVPVPPSPPAPAPKCRHSFVVASDGVNLCSKCGVPKRANGRPRNAPATQTTLAPVAK